MDRLIEIARIETGFSQKFGIPKQSGLVASARGRIVFSKEYRNPEFIRGIEEFDYLWLIWQFSENVEAEKSATVRPPRLGGKIRMGVFATRSPFRPNDLGLSSVKLEYVDYNDPEGPVLYVSGVDMLSGTPIFDIKPYVEFSDSHVGVRSGFSDRVVDNSLPVDFPEELLCQLPEDIRDTVHELLIEDPRAAYDKEKERKFYLAYGGFDIGFFVEEDKIRVTDIKRLDIG